MVANEKSPFLQNEGAQSLTENQESSENIDIYFSWHERMVNGDYLDSERTMFRGNF